MMEMDVPPFTQVWADTPGSSRRKKRVKKAIFLRDRVFVESINDYIVYCGICKQPLGLRESTIDHVVPRSKGGSDFITNFQLAHEVCNKNKGNKLNQHGDGK